ncbi:glycosyl hydrolase family 32 [Cyclobacteriaceae bacterium]|nr:glycosyl hydrolase family 32 [Cyclobacteriaceae bacterium]
MYSGAGFSDWEIGDIDVFIDENGKYHLFHLIIPNHDYIAHAVSDDCISWERTKNALFVGDPGEWDDDMLWTMHVSKNHDKYVMYYTGLMLADRGVVQKIGRATSTDLVHWDKHNINDLPLESTAPHYENLANNPREWLSFRDPFRFDHEKERYLLICARSANGPTSRRGCVGLAQLIDGKYELQKPLHVPYVYDDVECPCVIEIKGIFFLLGSIREDIKVRYWTSPTFKGEYHAFHANVLLPEGNYAARTVKDGDHILVNNFYFVGGNVNTLRVLPPPKELDVDEKGRLILKSYYRWKDKIGYTWSQDKFIIPQPLLANPTAKFIKENEHSWRLTSKSGYEYFVCPKRSKNFIWEGQLVLEDLGKTGFTIECDREASGYHISLDYENGFVQFRKWGFNPKDNQNNFVFENLQTNQFAIPTDRTILFKIIKFGSYFEVSINGVVKLTLVDHSYTNPYIGIYTCSSTVLLNNSSFHSLTGHESEYTQQQNHEL